MKAISIILGIGLLASLLSCGSIRKYRELNPSEGVNTVSVGGLVFRLDIQEDLPNAFGRADLYGGKVRKGYAEVRLVRIIDDTKIELSIIEQRFASTETTMDRYGGRFNVQQSIILSGDNSNTQVIDVSRQREMVISGVRLYFIEIQPYTLKYKLLDKQ